MEKLKIIKANVIYGITLSKEDLQKLIDKINELVDRINELEKKQNGKRGKN